MGHPILKHLNWNGILPCRTSV